MIERLRGDNARAAEENRAAARELDAARTRDRRGRRRRRRSWSALRDEREQIRSRVDDMLKQIEALNL